jgi:acetyltransferase-like isoleucine patch superfamily enzyme
MARPLSLLLAGWRRMRLGLWAARGRARLRWSGMRLRLEADDAPAGPLPRIDLLGRGGGTLTVRFGRGVRFDGPTGIYAEPGGDSLLQIGDEVRVSLGTRFKLLGGEVSLGPRTVVRDGAILKSGGRLSVGADCIVSYGVVVHCAESVTLEDRVALGDRTTVVDSTHETDGSDTPWAEQPAPSLPVLVRGNTMTFANVTILRGARIGRNSVVAAGAVVSGDHPDGVLLAGVPAGVTRILAERQ